MKNAVAVVTTKGQVTIPVEIRRHLGIQEHDKVEFTIQDDGCVSLHRMKYPTLRSLRGIAGTMNDPKDWDEVEETVREERADKIAKKLRG